MANIIGLVAPGNYIGDVSNDGVTSVTAAGTRVQLSSTEVPCEGVYIYNSESSAGIAVIGDVGVVAADSASRRGCCVLAPGEAAFLPVKDLSILYVDATVATTRVLWCAYK